MQSVMFSDLVQHDAKPCIHQWVAMTTGNGKLLAHQCERCTQVVEAAAPGNCIVCHKPIGKKNRAETHSGACRVQLVNGWRWMKELDLMPRETLSKNEPVITKGDVLKAAGDAGAVGATRREIARALGVHWTSPQLDALLKSKELEEVDDGGAKAWRLRPPPKNCSSCHGTGWSESSSGRCRDCSGTGKESA